jgi:hypothetical protein
MNSKIMMLQHIFFDCQITFADGRVQTYFAGTIIIEQILNKMIQVNQINEYINITVTGITQDIVITVTDLT